MTDVTADLKAEIDNLNAKTAEQDGNMQAVLHELKELKEMVGKANYTAELHHEMNQTQLCQELRISPATFSKWGKTGKLSIYRTGKGARYTKADLEQARREMGWH